MNECGDTCIMAFLVACYMIEIKYIHFFKKKQKNNDICIHIYSLLDYIYKQYTIQNHANVFFYLKYAANVLFK